MTGETLVNLSEIEKEEGFREFDYAIPMNRDGSYPHNGNAIAVYYDTCFEIVSYRELAMKAINRYHETFRHRYDVWDEYKDDPSEACMKLHTLAELLEIAGVVKKEEVTV